MSESIILAIIAIASPIIVGIVKALLGARKVKVDSGVQELQTHTSHNEFLHRQLETFRKYHEQQMDNWRTRYDTLKDKYAEEQRKTMRLEFELERMKEAAQSEGDEDEQTGE